MTCHDVMTPGVFYWTTPKLQTKKSPKPPRPTKRLKTNRPITKTQDSRSATPQQPRVGNSVWPIFVLHILAKWIFLTSLKQKNAESGIPTNLNLSYPPIPYIWVNSQVPIRGDCYWWQKSNTSWYAEYPIIYFIPVGEPDFFHQQCHTLQS